MDEPQGDEMSERQKYWRHHREHRRRMLTRLFERHEGRCAHCGKECVRNTSHVQHHNSATVDHDPPRSELPMEEWFNLDHAVLSCFECNNGRAQEMQKEGGQLTWG